MMASKSTALPLGLIFAASIGFAGCAANGTSTGSDSGAGGAQSGTGGSPAAGGSTGATGVGGTTGPSGSGGATGAGGSPGLGGRPGLGGSPGFGGSDAGAGTDSGGASDGGTPGVDGGSPPPLTGPSMAGTVTVARATTRGHLAPGFAGFSFEKTHMTDGFFAGTNGPLIALFKLLGPGFVRIGANDVDASTWVPNATPVPGGQTSHNIGTVEVDALAAFLRATGWKAIYGVSMRTAIQPSVDEAVYATSKLGSSLHSLEIGNEINFFANNAVGTPTMQWESFQTAIHAMSPTTPLAGPAAAGAVTTFTVPFANAEGGKIILLTEHYYKGAASSNPTIANILTIDPSVVTQSQALAAAVQANRIADGYRWGEMNSYSGHGAAGVSDVFASALWGIDFMLTTAQYGAVGVNFHSGGQNMDGNVCNNGVTSCTRPFRYSPIVEVDSQVTAAAPLFYGMLLVAQAGVGDMLPTTVAAGGLNFSAYTIKLADGSTNVVLVNKDATNGVNARVDVGTPVVAATGTYLLAPALSATTGVTLAGASITSVGVWSPKAPYNLPVSGAMVTVGVPPASAVLVHAR